ncbi:MAG TPA: hypothetical protein VGW33_04925 [Terriglobia bacterium]|nr:hypothetical protein [Terriglobia bacterium]
MTWFKRESAVLRLAKAITRATFNSAERFKKSIRSSTDQERLEKWVYVMFEFMYFYMHMSSRVALEVLGPEQRGELCGQLAPLVARPVLGSVFGHWPEGLKAGLERDVYNGLSEAESAYSSCEAVFIKYDLLTDKGVFNRLAKNVAEVCGEPVNPAVLMLGHKVATDEWKAMGVYKLAAGMKKRP